MNPRITLTIAAWLCFSAAAEAQRPDLTFGDRDDHTAMHPGIGLAFGDLGRAAMKQGATSRIVVQPGETFRLWFAVYVHFGAEGDAIANAYGDYAKLGQ